MNTSDGRPNRCPCGKSFRTVIAMDQHRRDAAIHAGSSTTAAYQPPPPQLATTVTRTETTGTETATSEAGAAVVAAPGGGLTQSETKSKKKTKGTKGEGKKQERPKFKPTARSSPYSSTYSEYPISSPQYKVNLTTGNMMDMWQDQNWALCDKDCGWCGHCYD